MLPLSQFDESLDIIKSYDEVTCEASIEEKEAPSILIKSAPNTSYTQLIKKIDTV